MSQILESQSAAAAAAAAVVASNSNGTNTTENSPGKSKLTEDIPRSPNLKLRSSPRGSPRTGSLRRRNKSAPRTAHDFDEREIPTLRQ